MTPISVTEPTAAAVRPPAAAPVAPKHYLVGLDALRAVVALSVCLFHYTGGMVPKLMVPAAQATFSRGYLGVDIFFVISGFIIPYSLVGKNHQVAGFFAYLKKRVLHINPPAYAFLFLVLGQCFLIDRLIQHANYFTGGLSWGQLLNNVLFTMPLVHYKWINDVFWMLTIEFQSYLFIGLLFGVLFERLVGWVLGLYVLVAAISFLPGTESMHFIRYSSLFALGGMALLWQQRRISQGLHPAGLVGFGALTCWQIVIYSAYVGVGAAVGIDMLRVRILGLSF